MWKFAFFCSSNNAKDLSIAHNSFTDLSRANYSKDQSRV